MALERFLGRPGTNAGVRVRLLGHVASLSAVASGVQGVTQQATEWGDATWLTDHDRPDDGDLPGPDRIDSMPPSYVVLLPVKPPARGKSRLEVDPVRRRALAAAFALDTARACLAAEGVSAVLAVTDDARFADDLRAAGCATIPDGVTDDLNESLRLAAAEARRRWPEARPVAVCADLPSLSPEDLDAALSDAGAATTPAFVADGDGLGTTLYTAAVEDFAPRFGPASRQAHLDAGAREIEGDLPSLRRDVDDANGLAAAVALGLGAHTRLALLA